MSKLRQRFALASLKIVNGLSRRLGKGHGTVAGGRVGLRLDPHLLESLGAQRPSVIVSGTNGKTTTTALLAAALAAGGGRVVTNQTGSNMPAGHVAALAGASTEARAVLEVDEAYVPQLLAQIQPRACVLLNLSRDQLDRMSEVRMIAERWKRALALSPNTTVVANADDPLITFAASGGSHVVWVAAGLAWKEDATGCPCCGGRIAFAPGGAWACTSCEFARPESSWRRHDSLFVTPNGEFRAVLALPGDFNKDNALMALCAASVMGVDEASSIHAFAQVVDVAGRFISATLDDTNVRLLLAKNPAGWSALLALAEDDPDPVVVAINSRVADGLDPSWLWDVNFAPLRGRRVVASGERWRDLSVRLRYAEIEHETAADGRDAVRLASQGGKSVDVIGNYTAFNDLVKLL